MKLLVKRDSKWAGLKSPAYAGDAGFDMGCSESRVIHPGLAPVPVPCGFAMALPEGFMGLVMPRSSAVARGLMVASTVIDSGYRGPMFVMVWALWPTDGDVLVVEQGERIAQLVPIRIATDELELVDATSLPPHNRGVNGFGSSGR